MLVVATDNTTKNSVESNYVSVTVQEARRIETLTIAPAKHYHTEELLAVVGRAEEVSISATDQYGDILNEVEGVEWIIEGTGSITDNAYVPVELGLSKITAKIGEVESNELEINTLVYNNNVALQKDVEASRENAEAEMWAINAVDGNSQSRWTHTPTDEENIPPYEYEAWITVDLGEEYDIDMIELFWEGACAADYGIYYSLDNEDFGAAVYAMENVEGMRDVTHQFYNNPGKARYVKMHATKASTQYGISLYEFRIFTYLPLIADRDETHITLTGSWSLEDFNEIDHAEVTSYDMSQVNGLVVKPTTQNPNCLIYVNAGSVIAGEDNVIAGDKAERIVLEDGYPYSNITEFDAEEVIYTRDFSGMNGWATLYLPFAAELGNRTIEYFSSYEGDNTIYFEETKEINANTPYIYKVNAETGIQVFRAQGTINLPVSGETNYTTPEDSEFTFKGTFITLPEGDERLIMKADGSSFAVSTSEIAPFRAYVEANNGNNSVRSLSILHDGETTGIYVENAGEFRMWAENGVLGIISSTDQLLSIYALDGRLVGKIEVKTGANSVAGLAKGIYVINNQKVVIN